MKHCLKCDIKKPVVEFSKCASRRDGLQAYCKACKKMADAKWYAANSERHRENDRAWRDANPERVSVIDRNRNAKRKTRKLEQSVGVVTTADIAAILAQPCLACGTRQSITIEHLVPLARGGAHSIGNLAPLCQSCNSSKNSMLWVEWKYSKRPRALEVFTAA